jgi:transcriptional regulator with XRE-family HTH domain
MATEAQPLSSVIGRELRTLREAGGVRQEQLAAEARRFGLPWTRATVAAIELGRRQLFVGELLLLPLLLGHGGAGWGYDLADFVPDDARPVLIAGGAIAPARVVRQLLANPQGVATAQIETPKPPSGGALRLRELRLPRHWLLDVLAVTRIEDVPEPVWIEVALEAAGDAESKASAALGVPAFALALAARRQWGRSLTNERDERVGRQTESDDVEARSLQARRGHITRALLHELRPALKGVKATKTTKTKRRRTP